MDPAPADRAPVVLAAYVLVAGLDATAAAQVHAGLGDLPIDGLELPLAEAHLGSPVLSDHLRPAWELVVTCVPTVLGRLAADPAYGLASADPAGRARAVADLRQARDLAADLAQRDGW